MSFIRIVQLFIFVNYSIFKEIITNNILQFEKTLKIFQHVLLLTRKQQKCQPKHLVIPLFYSTDMRSITPSKHFSTLFRFIPIFKSRVFIYPCSYIGTYFLARRISCERVYLFQTMKAPYLFTIHTDDVRKKNKIQKCFKRFI